MNWLEQLPDYPLFLALSSMHRQHMEAENLSNRPIHLGFCSRLAYSFHQVLAKGLHDPKLPSLRNRSIGESNLLLR